MATASEELPTVQEILDATGLFSTLGLAEAVCEPAIIKARYKQLALRVHPDKCSDVRAKEAFQRISEAFERLHTREAQQSYLRENRTQVQARKQRTEQQRKRAEQRRAWWDTKTFEEFERRFRNREKMTAAFLAKFQTRVQGQFQHRRLRRQVLNAERSCEQLDRSKELSASELWPPELRELPNKAELQQAPFEGAKTAWDELLERHELEDPEYCANRLADLLTHLRTVHVYCLHCGCHFEDAADLESSCPGFDEEAHENAENMAMRTSGVTRELAPPPKRRPPREAPRVEEDDDPLNALAAKGAKHRREARTGPSTGSFVFQLRPK